MSFSTSISGSPRKLLLVFTVIVLLSGLAAVVQAQPPTLILSKTTDGSVTTAEVGQIINYRIRFECSSLSGPCGVLEITDVLQPGLTYLPPPESSVPAGFNIAYNPGTRTITITKADNNFLDGTQFDAVIAVQVDYDFRPLPNTIDNTVNGRIDPENDGTFINATPDSAPTITVDTATEDWGMTKTLYRPSINPTLDTDVTYQIALCPNTNIGNVALTNITITDTLPAGAVFVSASDGGTEAGGVVTFPTVAGPVYPPDCITRYVTVQYPDATFNIGDNVTNTASANASYTDDTGGIVGPVGVATDPITHPIDPIAETPDYSKNDVGDPVGINGTGRFILSLDTSNTNFPPDDLALIDNLPPELQVTEVTSGTWDVAFSNVTAFVEYSTNNGSSYTAFPGQPVSYNTGALYTAPATNITNVRWRFQYEDPVGVFNPGLPYTWTFTGQPEIRFIPRATAGTADPPSGAALPAATAGSTYNNCLQITRTNSTGNPVTGACDNETVTIQGNFVSLRTYKDETPGAPWDDLDDPNITTFTPDTSILPNDTVLYTITIEVTERSSAPLIDPVIRDTIPAGLIFVRNGTARLDGTALPGGQQPTFTQAGSDLTWSWGPPSLTVTSLALGSRFLTVEFYARIPRGQAPGSYTNNLAAVTDSVDVVCEIGTTSTDAGNLDGDASNTEPLCLNTDDYVVERSAALRGEKWIRSTDATNAVVVDSTTFLPSGTCPGGGTTGMAGGGSNAFTRFPCISQAFPDGALSPGQLVPPPASTTLDDFEYNIRIFNDGNVDMTQYVLYDILPYFGDTGSGGTLSTTSRLSEFQPALNGPIELIAAPGGLTTANFTIEYNNSNNPCRPEVFNLATGVNMPGGCNNTWSAAWSTSARSFRIRMNAGVLFPQTAVDPVGLRFGVPMNIPSDVPPTGFDANDAQSLEIAWNSFSHTGSYLDPLLNTRDLLASEPRKVGITVPERLSVGNRVWRDADNSGTINPPDDVNPGIANVTVNLYHDTDSNGIPDGAAIATVLTDANGYYLFSNIIPGDPANPTNRYVIGIPASNFGAGQPLLNLRSSTGPLPAQAYVTPPEGATDSDDNGIDPATPGLEVLSASFTLAVNTEPAAETVSGNARDGLNGRGVNGERDNDSDLRFDFGFFSQVDLFSIGNRVWYDSGAGGGVINNGIKEAGEPPVVNARVELYRDGNANGQPDAAEFVRFDTTDAGGYYLFDQLDPGTYFVVLPATNFAVGAPLAGWNSSQPTGTETVGVPGNPTTPNMDGDDNGRNVTNPATSGVQSGTIVLILGTPETTGETDLSGDTGTAGGNNPTAGDGPGSIGRFGEDDDNSNITIDFGFIPPMSIGNRVWLDNGSTAGGPDLDQFNDGLQNGNEPGIDGVALTLFMDFNSDGDFIDAGENIRTTTTSAGGYYLFDGLAPGNYQVRVNSGNFGAALIGLESSTGSATGDVDEDDNGVDDVNYLTNGIRSIAYALTYGGEPLQVPLQEEDIPAASATFGPDSRGRFGEADADSNLTVDFGFVNPPFNLGNRVWRDDDNDGNIDVGEPGIDGVTVRLLDSAGNPVNNPNLPGVQDYTLITDGNGYYRFDGLPAGDYIVEIAAANFNTGSPLNGRTSSTGAEADPDTNGDSNDNGLDAPVAGAIRSGIVTLGPGAVEPTAPANENDVVGGGSFVGQGPGPDNRANMTVDFGFYNVYSLGNRVWIDDGTGGGTLNDGLQTGGEIGIGGVTLLLLDGAGAPYDTDLVTAGVQQYTLTTDANGYYRFDNLRAGAYIVEIQAANFTAGTGALFGYASSTGAGQQANPDTNIDQDDNGIDTPVAGAIRSGVVNLGPGDVEPTDPAQETDVPGAGAFAGQGSTPDNRSNLTVDFGFFPAYTLGNRVWLDIDNSGDINGADGGTPGVANVTVRLLTTGGAPVDNPNLTGTQDYILTTDATGFYRFDNLPAGDYVVEIAAANFNVGGVLESAISSTGAAQEADPNGDVDSNDNGLDAPVAGAIRSNPVTLGPGNSEPLNELAAQLGTGGQGPTVDGRANMTVDFGFVPRFSLGNRVWLDDGIGGGVSNDGIINGGEAGIANVDVQLMNFDGTPYDSDPLTAGVQPYILNTDASGYYRFDDLPAGDYLVEILQLNFNTGEPLFSFGSSTGAEADPDADGDSNDNGIDALPAVAVRSGVVTLGPGYNEPRAAPPGAVAEIDVPGAGTFAGQGAVDDWSNLTVDFGFVRLFSLGNRVWRDDGTGGGVLNNGFHDGNEPGINAVVVRLLDGVTGNPADNPNIAGVQDYTVTTSPQGYYRFDNLPPGDYIVEIVASNFTGGGTLANFFSSTGALQEPDPDTNGERNDNGLDAPVAGGIRSAAVTLGALADEPLFPGVENDVPLGQGAPDAQANMTVDFGFVPGSYSLGNRVWIDTDNSGDINGGEAGVDGVTVRLLTTGGVQLATTTTAGGGYYRFDNLAAGNYVVEVAASSFGMGQPLNGLVSSTGAAQEANPNADFDSNDNGGDTPFAGAIRSGTVTLGPGDSEPITEADLGPGGQGATNARANMTVDFGFNTPPTTYTLGNRVWFDADNDGSMNAFDGPTPGIAGVTVNLLNTGGAIVATTTTDANGYYRFDNLAANDYIVEVAATNFTGANPLFNLISSSGILQEANPNTDVDRNDNGLDLPVGGAIRSGTVTLGPGTTEPTTDTDVSGAPGGAPDNQSNLSVDFGFTNAVNVYTLGNRVWLDNGAGANGNNGRHDAGENGIAGVTVNLLDSSGTTIVATTMTDSNGYYRFDNLPAGDYRVEIAAANFGAGQPLDGRTSSTGAFQEANPNADVDRNDNGLDVPVAGAIRSGLVTLGPGASEPTNDTDVSGAPGGAANDRSNLTVDFGFIDSYSLGNRVWRDDGAGGGTADNGIHEPGEIGIDGVTVRLLDSTGTTVLATTTTAGGGYYRFDNLTPGNYIVEIASGNFGAGQPLNGLSSSPVTNANPNSDIDRDDNGIDTPVAGAIRSGQVTLGPGNSEPTTDTDVSGAPGGAADDRSNLSVDFGFNVPTNTYSLGNRVWLDDGAGGGTANNGLQDGTEIGMVGVTVNLLDGTGVTVLATTTTDPGGYYRFDNLAAGDYIVEIAANNFAVAQPLNGLLSSAVTTANPNTNDNADQRDDNGIDAPPGSAVRSGVVTMGPGGSEPLGETDLSGVAPAAPDDRDNMTVDFGFAAPTGTYSIGNRVWLDDDNSGDISGAEVGIAGVLVRLLDSTGTTIIATATTDANGYYRFDNLAPGNYLVEIASTNFTPGQPLQGLASSTGALQEANPNTDGDINDNGLDTFVGGGIRSGTVTLGPGNSEPTVPTESDVPVAGPFAGQGSPDNHSNLTVDFGFTASYSLGNRVWFDTNNDSLRGAGEIGIANVRVELYRDTDANGVYTPGTDVLINFVNTDPTGYYLFTGLAAADYVVVIPGSNFDNTGDPLFGYYSSATTRNPADGTLTETAAPDPDTDTDDDDNGFTSGVLGTPTAYVASSAVTIGPGLSEPTTEGDLTSATFPDTTPNDRSNISVDFGFYTMTLGNLVWFDADDNGLLNGTEAGLDGVTVHLYALGSNLAGAPLATTVTATGGQYSFPGLAAGEYIVRIPASNFTGVLTGFSSSTGGAGNPYETPPGVDPDPAIDSDDNGVHTAGPASLITSSAITLTPAGAGTIVDNATGRTTNNTLDFGLRSSAPLIFSLGNRVFMDFNNNGVQDTGEPGIPGVQMRLLDTANNPVDDPNLAGVQDYLVTTDASGYYRFDNLPAGDYIVQVLEANFLAGGTLENQNSSGPDELLPNNNVDRNDNGIGTAFIPGLGIVSGVVTLGPTEPTGETDIGLGGQGAVDFRANMTVDFGFTPPTALIITKDDGINAILVGSTTTYTVTIFNNTAVDQLGVTFTDNVPTLNPEGFDPNTISWSCTATGTVCPTTASPPAPNPANANINETLDLFAGSRVVYTITGRVRSCSTACGISITNLAQLSTGQSDDDVNGIISDPPRGAKTGTVVNGTTIHWEMLWFSTTAPAVGQAVVISDTLQVNQTFAGNLTCTPAGLTVTISCGFSGNTVTWEGTIFGGTANQLIIGFDVTVPGDGTYNNDAVLTEPGTNVRINASATVDITGGGGGGGQPGPGATAAPPLDPTITVTPNPPFGAPGTPVDWAVNVGNPNPFPLNNVIITIPVPPELVILGVDAPPDAIVTINGNLITIVIPSLPPGAYPTITIRTRIIRSIAMPFAITLTASLNTCPCSGSGTVTSISALPATGEPRPVSFGGLLLITISVSAGVALVVVRWRKYLYS